MRPGAFGEMAAFLKGRGLRGVVGGGVEIQVPRSALQRGHNVRWFMPGCLDHELVGVVVGLAPVDVVVAHYSPANQYFNRTPARRSSDQTTKPIVTESLKNCKPLYSQ